MHHRNRFASILLAAALSPSFAGTSALMQVSARIAPRVQIAISQAPALVQVSASDVERGYVDIPGPVRLAIDSNVRRDLRVEFFPVQPWVAAAEVAGSALPSLNVELSPGRFTQRAVALRLILAPSAAPGAYPWPVQVAAVT